MPRPLKAERLTALLQALADRTRLRLLNLMATQEMCVCYFVEVLQTTQPKVSRHLAYLRRNGIVTARRDHRWIHYQLRPPTDPSAARLLREVLAAVSNDPQMQRDRFRLSIICSTPQKFVNIQNAPLPSDSESLEVVRDEDQNNHHDHSRQARFGNVAH